MKDALCLVNCLDAVLLLLVSLSMRLCVPHHILDLVLGESSRRLDDNLLLLAGALVTGVDVDYAVGINVESNLDLRLAQKSTFSGML